MRRMESSATEPYQHKLEFFLPKAKDVHQPPDSLICFLPLKCAIKQ
jgi:hypothetical protein